MFDFGGRARRKERWPKRLVTSSPTNQDTAETACQLRGAGVFPFLSRPMGDDKIMKTLAPTFFIAAALTLNAEPALTIYNQNFAVVRDSVPVRH